MSQLSSSISENRGLFRPALKTPTLIDPEGVYGRGDSIASNVKRLVTSIFTALALHRPLH
jgi:hypothetical protein